MSDWWPKDLVDAIARRRAVVLIGSGVSANAKTDTGERPPTWGQFLEKAYTALGKSVPHIKKSLARYSYLEACDYLKTEHAGAWNGLLKASFSDPYYKPSEIHQAIFDLDSRIVASLNFDKIYETYALKASENTVIVKNYYDDDFRQTVAGPDRYIIKPHGTIDTMSKMIFTLEDYAQARVKYSSFYEVITALLHTHIFVCVGCGLSDPDIKLIFEDYRYKHGESPHYMTIPKPINDSEAALIRKTRGLNVLQYSPKDDHKELTTRIFELGELVVAKRNEMAELQSW